MPYFLTQIEVYDIINRELPEGLFAYSADPSKFYITSDLDSKAKVIADGYSTMHSIYDNMFINTASEQLTKFETMHFGATTIGTLTDEERRGRLFAKIRSHGFVSAWDILSFIVSYVPVGTYVQIVEYGSSTGKDTWTLGLSELGTNTFLGYENLQQLCGARADEVWGQGWVYLDPLPTGVTGNPSLTQAQVLAMRKQAYTYEIRLFNYTLSSEMYADLIIQLNKLHPTRSDYNIVQNANLADYDLTVEVDNVDQFSGINCMKSDATMTITGYKGIKQS